MQIVERDIGSLVPYENNPRHNEDAVKFVAASIKEFGFKVPVVIDEKSVIVAGHTRVLAAKELGIEKIPCIVDIVCRRLQLQERIGFEIANILQAIVGVDVCVRIEASHSCMTARGIKSAGAKTVTFTRRGAFSRDGTNTNPYFKEFMAALGG